MLSFHLTLLLTLLFFLRSRVASKESKEAENAKNTVNVDDYLVEADWAKMLKDGEAENAGAQNVGAYDTGKQHRDNHRKHNHMPLEAFIGIEPHFYYDGATMMIDWLTWLDLVWICESVPEGILDGFTELLPLFDSCEPGAWKELYEFIANTAYNTIHHWLIAFVNFSSTFLTPITSCYFLSSPSFPFKD